VPRWVFIVALLLGPDFTVYCTQALCKQFAQTLQFVFAFDDSKMKNPGIQNDFSYYRRTLSRTKMNTSVCPRARLAFLTVRDLFCAGR
jgi:hypothetical protein